MFKKTKKFPSITIEEKKGHLFLGGKKLRLMMVRPIEILEFAEFAGANADDIIIWVGKTIGKYFAENIYPEENWEGVKLSDKKTVVNNILDQLMQLGYGIITSKFKKDNILVSVQDPLSEGERDNIMAKNLCLLYQGLFNGVFETLDIDAEGQETMCYLLGDDACVFKFDLLLDEFEDGDVDPDDDAQAGVSGFLGTL